MENGNGETSNNNNNNARLAIMELANMISVPMSLNAIIKLKVADAIWEGGSNAPLSPAEILAKIRPQGGGDAENLQRILRMLTSYRVFEEHVVDDGSQRSYSLTEVGKTLVTDENGLSHGLYVLQHHQDELMRVWTMVHETVNDSSSDPFVKVYGERPYSYYGKNPEMNSLMFNAMSGVSMPFMKAMLERYDGFEGVKTLVDVGGSVGDCLKMILEKHSSIELGINFDLPKVVEKAPQIPRIKHVGGDMLDYIPKGDAIFMKRKANLLFVIQFCLTILMIARELEPFLKVTFMSWLFIVPKASTALRKNTGSSVELPVSLTARVSTSIISSRFLNFTSNEYNCEWYERT
ncbi:hypothetical protein AABB24_017543 [Solanum stoloniferum]|uniref:O-methyltransferase n=1 Tax=Solanum stoloniferum TaxID=62892 RepID=A0ABD2TKW8_9SOLN